ncbi:hypothetical protein BGZ65_010160 [Modicella reniformis]|uniref:Uncharacterized protein n=1 Tax=Modicella reniformis TaxID=1440133 RepID=A0A9P6SUR9_9FUNG|nr:hypothetical protein BGZ65_010160 [Modicella reniformis]
MLFSTSARSSAAAVFLVVLATLAFLASAPTNVQAANCFFECTPISSKILFCGNLRDSFKDKLPTIGVDADLDKCLCNQDNIGLYRSCLACQDPDNAVNITNKFISDCKITDSNRVLVNGASSLPSAAAYLFAAVASLGMAATLGL